MKLNFFRFLALAATLAVLCSTAYAQSINVRSQVPFNFVVGDKVYPAGEYAIQTLANYNSLLFVGNRDAKESAMTLSYSITSGKPAKHTVLVFQRMGNAYFLYQVWAAGSPVGREFPASRSEILLAQNGTKPDTTIVAADITP
jgi:hypothetical protein